MILKTPKNFFSLQAKLVMTFLLTSTIIFTVTITLFSNVNYAFDQIDSVYMSNVSINTLSDALTNEQNALTAFLDTKSTDSLENYYRYSQDYSQLLNNLSSVNCDNDVLIMEKNIRTLSENYSKWADAAVKAKRSRNIIEYKASYEKATTIYGYIGAYIYSLNNVQFKDNSASYNKLHQTFGLLEGLAIFNLLAVIILNVVITVLITRSITSPLRKLADYAGEISRGNFDVPALDITSHDEIATVSKAFNQMVINIKEYIEKLKTSMETSRLLKEKELLTDTHLKEAELKYLQAQINPHFLFNTLNAGTQLAMMENADTTYKYLQNVAAFFRNKTNREKQITTLESEISLVDSYIYIINVRFSGSIVYEKRIDEDLVNVSVPSMILQPIIENAINHGIRDIDREGHILLSVYKSQGDICISIKDNGKGMTHQQIEALLQGEAPVHVKGDETNGVGLTNVISRLKLFYNRDDVFDITSAGEDKGTEVILYIPDPK